MHPSVINAFSAAAAVLGCLLLIPAAYARLGSGHPPANTPTPSPRSEAG